MTVTFLKYLYREANMKKFLVSALVILTAASLFAFEWPFSEVTKDSFKSYFGQHRGKKISTSLVFNEPDQVTNSEDGRILVIIADSNDDSDFFPSTLGTAVIISHEDNLLSVYGNLDEESITINNINETFIEKGTILGITGNSGYQSEQSSLEFQIIDTKNSTAINPKVLMSRMEAENKYVLSDISIMNRNGEIFSLNNNKTFPAGLYKVYQKRNTVVMPSKTSVLFNGVVVDELTYNTIAQENGKICINGTKKKYTSDDVYPRTDIFLLGETMLTPGKITLGLIVTDAMGQTSTLNYNLSIY